MGWWWSSSSSPSSSNIQKDESSSIPSPPKHDAPLATSHPPDPAEQKVPPRQLTRDEQAEAELQSFLAELSTSTADDKPASFFGSSPSLPPASNSPDNIHPTAIYPTQMSCRSAFDLAWSCQLPGGQFVNVYRYGQLRNCSENWSDFWFCMRTNRGYMSEEERRERIRKHYYEKDEKYRTGPSSEDVWKVREKKVDEPFVGDFEAYERSVRRAEERERERGG